MKSRVHPNKTHYPVGKWCVDERALVNRGDVTLWLSPDARAAWIAPPSGRPGGQQRFSNLAIDTSLTLRLVFRRAVRQHIPYAAARVPTAHISPLPAALANAQAPRRFTLQLIGLFSAIALGLAALGVYGLVSEAVSQRVPEFGIRMALGAAPTRILRSVIAYGAGIVVIGATIGLLGAAVLNRTMESLVFGVETTDVVAYVTASIVLILATLAASLIPAQRAASVDPVRALRQE